MGHPTYIREAGKKAQISPADYKAPCLSQALLKGDVNKVESLITPKHAELRKAGKTISLSGTGKAFDDELADLLTVLQERLAAGCGEAWLADEAYGASLDQKAIEAALAKNPPSEDDKKKPEYYQNTYAAIWDLLEFASEPEEVWARTFSEMVLFSMYGNPGHIHYWKDDASSLFSEYPKVYAILMACQYLSTYAILTRGFPASDVGAGMACSGATIKRSCFDTTEQTEEELGLKKAGADKDAAKKGDEAAKAKKGTRPKSELGPPLPKDKTKQESSPYFSKTDIIAKKQAGPGSVLSFNPGGPAEGSQNKGPITHVATILRRHGDQVQFIDTGVLVGTDEGKMAGGEGGTTDHSFVRGTVPASSSCVAIGVLKPPPGDLLAAAKTASQCRPLAFSRLAIVDVSKKDPVVRFVSRMCQAQYPVARYIWSLRGLPITGLRVIWSIYVPQGEEFTNATIKGEALSPDAIWKQARPEWEKRKAINGGTEGWVVKHQMSFFPTNYIRGEDTGKAVVARHKVDKSDGWVEDFEAPMDSQMPKQPKPEMGRMYKLDIAQTLGGFSASSANLDKQYICRPGETGKLDDGGAEFLKPKGAAPAAGAPANPSGGDPPAQPASGDPPPSQPPASKPASQPPPSQPPPSKPAS